MTATPSVDWRARQDLGPRRPGSPAIRALHSALAIRRLQRLPLRYSVLVTSGASNVFRPAPRGCCPQRPVCFHRLIAKHTKPMPITTEASASTGSTDALPL